MTRKFTLWLCCLFLSAVSPMFAQQLTITGTVRSAEDKQSLPGASVLVKGTTNGTQTDAQGHYRISVAQGATLVFSFVGTKTQEIVVRNANPINVSLSQSANSLNDVVVVGYGSQRRANLTGAVTSVDIKQLADRPTRDISKSLQGAVPGLTITSTTGEISESSKIRLRGALGSVNAGGAQPLILVDNVEIPDIKLVNWSDVANISILKDAASTSIYGTRAAFGVILITTKSGSRNAPVTVTYTNNFAYNTPTVTPKLMNGADNSQYTLLALQRTNPNTQSFNVIGYSIDAFAVEKMKEWNAQYGDGKSLGREMVKGRDWDIVNSKLYFYRSWNPEDEFLKKWSPQQSHNLNVNGGSSNTTYNFGLGYIDQPGSLNVNPDTWKRYNLNLSVNTTVNKWLDLRGNVMYTNTDYNTPYRYGSETYNYWYYLYRWPANYPYGTYDGKEFRGAIAETRQAAMTNNKYNLTKVSTGFLLKPVKDLTIDGLYTYTSTNNHYHAVGAPTYAWDFWSFNGTSFPYINYQSASADRALYTSNWSAMNTGKIFATYSPTVSDDHHIKGIVGMDIDRYEYHYQSSERRQLMDATFGELGLAIGDQYAGSSASQWSTLGFFGRINYDYKNRYLLEVNGRYDGSSKFPTNKLWGFFPSASAGWILSEEDFMQNTKSVLSFAKLRASYGSIGNQYVGSYGFLPIMSSSTSGWWLPTGNTPFIGTPQGYSSSITWETMNTFDVGVDLRFWNKLGLTFDYFDRRTLDMLSPGATLPSTLGRTSVRQNAGTLSGKGFEVALDFNHTFENGLHLGLNANLSDAVEKITKYPGSTKPLPNAVQDINSTYYPGMTIGEIWGYESDRLFTVDDFQPRTDPTAKWVLKDGIPSQTKLESGSFYFGPGDMKYKDLNGDGIIFNGANTTDDHGDMKIIGNSTPRYLYGFNLNADYKGFDISAFIQGVGKRNLWGNGPVVFPGFRGAEGYYENQLDYYDPTSATPNVNAFYPRPTDYGAALNRWNFLPQTRYLLNMAYTRLKNVQIGYTFPQNWMERVKVKKLRIYVSGENLATIHHLGEVPIDPEIDYTTAQINGDVGAFGRAYPYRKTFSFGLQLTL